MKIAVTAATGQLGSAIALAAKKQLGKEQVVGLARSPEKSQLTEIEVRPGDYNQVEQLQQSLRDIDAVLLISANGDPQKRPAMHRNVINAAKSAGVKKMVYTSIMGPISGAQFSGVVQSNRQTEEDIRNSGLLWSIGRNGLYLEPDLEYLPRYIQEGKIWNSAGMGKCPYTTRAELADAYTQMLIGDEHNSQIYHLYGELITQQQLVDYFNQAYQLELVYENMSVEAYRKDRTDELGPFLGTIIAGIYEGIRSRGFEVPSQFERAAGRPHQHLLEYIREQKT